MGRPNGLTRRELVRRSAIATAAVGLAACFPTSSNAPSGSPVAAKPSPVRGGTLSWGQWDSNDDIDPANPSGSSASEIDGNIMDTLVAMGADQKIYPLLATKWEMTPDGTFTLRDGVKFHDGTAFDATSIKRSWERMLDPKLKAAANASLLGPIDTLAAPDARTFVVTYKDAYPLLLLYVWHPWYGPLSNAQLDTLKSGDKVVQPIGTGPYKVTGKSADGVWTLAANPDYGWGSDAVTNKKAPYVSTMKLRTVPEVSTRVATLESGENNLIDEVSEADYSRLKADKRFTFVPTPRRGLGVGFFINVQAAPTNELPVRQALNWAVDRKSIVDKLYFGVHKVCVGPLSEGVWGRLNELETRYTFDPDRARKLLDDAGWKVGSGGIREKNGQKLTLVLATRLPPWNEMADVLQSQYRDVGISVDVQKMASAPYLDYVRSYKHHLAASAGTNFDPDELRVRYSTGQIKGANFANLADSQLDALMVKGSQQAVGSDERLKTYADIQNRLMDQAPFVSIMTQNRIEGMSAKVHDLRMGPTGLNALAMTDTWIEP